MRAVAIAAVLIGLAAPAIAQDRSAEFASALHLRSDQQGRLPQLHGRHPARPG